MDTGAHMQKSIGLVAILTILCGCVTPHPSQLDSVELCDAFAHRDSGGVFALSKKVKQDLYDETMRRPGVIGPDFKSEVITHEVKVGMRETEVICSWGRPDHVNKTESRAGSSDQWVYERGYVYLRGGRVTSVRSLN
jgi:hypothetical protein